MRADRPRWARLGPWQVLVGLILLTTLIHPPFISPGNLINILRHAAVLAVAAFAQTLVIISGEIDLAMGSVVALVSMISVVTAKSFGTTMGLLAGVGVGGVAGAINGLLVGRWGVPSFIATVAMLSYAFGFASYLGGGIPIEFPPAGFNWLGAGYVGPIPVPVLVAGFAFALVTLLLSRSSFGRSLYLVGGNRRASAFSGINVGKIVTWAFIYNGVLTGVAGIILASRVNSGQPNLYPTLAFEAVGAVALGGIPLTGGHGRLSQTLAGVLIMSTLKNALTLINFSSQLQEMIMGAVIVFAVAVNVAPRLYKGSSSGAGLGAKVGLVKRS